MWQAIQEQVDEEEIILPAPIKDIMETWTLQMGFPLVNVTRNYISGSAVVTQVCHFFSHENLTVFIC